MDRSPLLYVYVGLPVQINQSGLVTLSLGYLCANFSLPRPLCSRLRPDVRDRQTDVRQRDVRQKHHLMPDLLGAGAY